MKLFARLILGLILLAALMPTAAVNAAAPASPQQQTTAISCNTFTAFGVLAVSPPAPSGAETCFLIPPNWNGKLVIFAHGYVFAYPAGKAVTIPWEQMAPGALTDSIPAMVLSQGFAFATTSYSKNGLAVTEGVAGVLELVDMFKTTVLPAVMPPGTPIPNVPVFLIGASEGGLVTTLAVEGYPKVFMGGVAACGPVGDFRKQINYWGDFRAAYDVYFQPNLLGDSAVNIPPEVMAGWYSGELIAYNAGLISQFQGNLPKLIAATGAPVDPLDPINSALLTTRGILDYNVMATDEAIVELGGNPYSNIDTVYPDPLLNSSIKRYEADKTALKAIKQDYQTKGLLKRPLVILHTQYDPIVPYWHATLYEQKVIQKEATQYLDVITVPTYGHCAFTAEQELTAFTQMLWMAQQQQAQQ